MQQQLHHNATKTKIQQPVQAKRAVNDCRRCFSLFQQDSSKVFAVYSRTPAIQTTTSVQVVTIESATLPLPMMAVRQHIQVSRTCREAQQCPAHLTVQLKAAFY
eukprot:5071249-Amphidinium_carterae.2